MEVWMNKILVVEDEDILREVIVDYLIEDGYQVLEAADGEKALELFQSNSVDLVILDIVLPKIDGWSVCRRIRKYSGIPIIILTARSDEDDSLMGYELGADDYLIKPYSPPCFNG
jgi:DNA-binding response OmpR family regulator